MRVTSPPVALTKLAVLGVLCLHVALQTAVLYEGLPAHVAAVTPVVGVYPDVVLQGLEPRVGLLAHLALVVPLAGVRRHVVRESEASEELLPAALAFVSETISTVYTLLLTSRVSE